MAREGDSKIAKKARILAEASLGQKNSILRHMQTGATATQRLPAKDIARKLDLPCVCFFLCFFTSFSCLFPFAIILFNYELHVYFLFVFHLQRKRYLTSTLYLRNLPQITPRKVAGR
jgi:hypothetical protein